MLGSGLKSSLSYVLNRFSSFKHLNSSVRDRLNVFNIHEKGIFFIFNYFFLNPKADPPFQWIIISSFLLFSPLLYGGIVTLRSLFRLLSNYPQVVIDKEGIVLGEYRAWGKIPWNGISHIKVDVRNSMSSQAKEKVLVFGFFEEQQKKDFAQEAILKLAYLDIKSSDLIHLVFEISQKAKLVQNSQNENIG